MRTRLQVNRTSTLEANRYVHAQLATSGHYNKSPHFLSENRVKVRRVLEELIQHIHSQHDTRLLDFGCGTGFIIHLVYDLVDSIDGVDITKEMMDQVDLTLGNIKLTECVAEHTPFHNNTFDIATAYSFMDHLVDYRELFQEAYRVLKPGGMFYADLNPNRRFIQGLAHLNESGLEIKSEIIKKEIMGALHNGDVYDNTFGIDPTLIAMAEPGKTYSQGFEANEVQSEAHRVGFRECSIHYDWFFSQGVIIHEYSFEKAQNIDDYLRSLLPYTANMYKYIRFIMKK